MRNECSNELFATYIDNTDLKKQIRSVGYCEHSEIDLNVYIFVIHDYI